MLTLRLFHGRRSLEEKLSDWGHDGPVLGPLRSVNATYCEELRLETTDGLVVALSVIRGLVYYGGVFYGDFEIGNELDATEQANEPRSALRSPAFQKALRELSESEKPARVSKRFAEIASVFLDAVRESEGEAASVRLGEAITRSVMLSRIWTCAAQGRVDLVRNASAFVDDAPQVSESSEVPLRRESGGTQRVDGLRRK
ncbi:MAG: hypothetical protein QM817_33940 [Archangium sp.]